jgi:hypothetical protein
VTLVDAAENPGGLSTGWRTPKGRAVEAGIKGFWYLSLRLLLIRDSPSNALPTRALLATGHLLQMAGYIVGSLIRRCTHLGEGVHELGCRFTLPWMRSG